MNLTRDELCTVIAALRYYQRKGMGDPIKRPMWLHELACDGDGTGDVVSLDADGIDDLVERLNCDDDDETLALPTSENWREALRKINEIDPRSFMAAGNRPEDGDLRGVPTYPSPFITAAEREPSIDEILQFLCH